MLSNPNLTFSYTTAAKAKSLIKHLGFELENNSYLAQKEEQGSTLIVDQFVGQLHDVVAILNDLMYELDKLDKAERDE